MRKHLGLLLSLVIALFSVQIAWSQSECDVSVPQLEPSLPLNEQLALYEQGNLKGALTQLQCALTLQPQDSSLLNQIGRIYGELGDYQNALSYLDLAVQYDSSNVLAYSNRGWVYTMTGHYSEALRDLNRALELDPTQAYLYSLRAVVYRSLGDFNSAEQDIQRALSLSNKLLNNKSYEPQLDDGSFGTSIEGEIGETSDTSPAANTLRQAGETFYLGGEYEQAIIAYEALVAFEANNPEYYFRLGFSYKALDQDAEAIPYLKQALILDSNYIAAHYGLAIAYSKLNMRQEAFAELDLLADYDTATVKLVRGIVYRDFGMDDAAAENFLGWMTAHEGRRQLVSAPQNGESLTLPLQYGLIYQMPFTAVAGEAVRISVQSHPYNDPRIDPLIVILSPENMPISGDDDNGDKFDSALNFIPPATGTYTLLISHAGAGSDGDVIVTINGLAQDAEIYRQLGQLAMKNGDYARTITLFSTAIGLDGGSGDDYFRIGFAFGQMGDYQDAINSYQYALDRGFDKAEQVYANMAVNYYHMGDLDTAAALYSHALTLKPDFSTARCYLGQIFMDWEQYQDAIEEYTLVLASRSTEACALYGRAEAQSKLGLTQAAFTDLGQLFSLTSLSAQDQALYVGNLWANLENRVLAGDKYLSYIGFDKFSKLAVNPINLNETQRIWMQSDAPLLYVFAFDRITRINIEVNDATPYDANRIDPLFVLLDQSGHPLTADNNSGLGRNAQALVTLQANQLYTLIVDRVHSQKADAVEILLTEVASPTTRRFVDYGWMGVHALWNQQYEKAADYFLKQINTYPDVVYAYINLGLAYYGMGEYDQAYSAYTNALIRGYEEDALIHSSVGDVLRMKGMYKQAYNHYEIALLYNSEFPNALIGMAETLTQLGDHAKAQMYRDMLPKADAPAVISPRIDPDYDWQGVHALWNQDYEKAADYFLKLIDYDPTAVYVYVNLGLAYYGMDEYDQAYEAYMTALERGYPEDALIHSSIADVLQKVGKDSEAHKHYTMALRYNKSFPDALRGMAETLTNMGDEAGAQSYLNMLPQPDAPAPIQSPRIRNDFDWQGVHALWNHDYEKAVSYFLKLIDYDPSVVYAHVNLGFAYYGMAEYDKALEAYNTALAKGYPQDALIYSSIGDVLRMQGKYMEAKQSYRTALSYKQNFPNAIIGKAESYYAMGNIGKAQAYADRLMSDVYADYSPGDLLTEAYNQSLHHNDYIAGILLKKASVAYSNAASTGMSEGLDFTETPTEAQIQYHVLSAKAAMEIGNYQSAIVSYEWLIENQVATADDFVNLAYAYYQVGQYDSAIDANYAALDAGFSDEALVYTAIGNSYRRMGEASKALEAYNGLFDHGVIFFKSWYSYRDYWIARVEAVYELGQIKVAQMQMNRNLRLYPQDMSPAQMLNLANAEADRNNNLMAGTLRLEAMKIALASARNGRTLSDKTEYIISMQDNTLYTFTVEAYEGDEIAINAGSTINSKTDPVVVFVNDDDVVIASDDNSGQGNGASFTVTIPKTGTYTLMMRAAQADKLGTAYVTLETIAEAPPSLNTVNIGMSEDMGYDERAFEAQVGYFQSQALYAMERGDYQSAIPALEWLVKNAPYVQYIHLTLGTAYSEVGRYQEAIDMYYEGLNHGYPDKPLVMLAIGDAYRLMGDARTAVFIYSNIESNSFKSWTDSLNLLAGRAEVQYQLNIVKSAEATARFAIQNVLPKMDDTEMRNLADVQAEHKNFFMAEALRNHAVSSPDGLTLNQLEFYRQLAYYALDYYEYNSAIAYLKVIVRNAPDDAKSHFTLGYAYFMTEQYQDSAASYIASLEAGYENESLVMLAIADAYRMAGDARTAVGYYSNVESDSFTSWIDSFNLLAGRAEAQYMLGILNSADATARYAIQSVLPKMKAEPLLMMAKLQEDRHNFFMAGVLRLEAMSKQVTHGVYRQDFLNDSTVYNNIPTKDGSVVTFPIEANQGENLTISAYTSARLSPNDPLLVMVNAEGIVIASSDDDVHGLDATFTVSITETGSYHVILSHGVGGGEGSMVITLDRDESPVVTSTDSNESEYSRIAMEAIQRNDLGLAMQYYLREIETHPQNANAYVGLGYVYHVLGRYREAVDAYNTAIDLGFSDSTMLQSAIDQTEWYLNN